MILYVLLASIPLVLGLQLLQITLFTVYRAIRLRKIKLATGGDWLLGHLLPSLDSKKYEAPWLYHMQICRENGLISRLRIVHQHFVAVRGPTALRQILQTKYQNYSKDLDLSMYTFLPILGTGLVTAHGKLWQEQRTLMTPALKVAILPRVVNIAWHAADRLIGKLQCIEGANSMINMEEEFRHVTLEVIAEAIASVPAEECSQVLPKVYLPIMEESNLRVLRRWRMFIPSSDWWAYRSRLRLLNQYVKGLIMDRWSERVKGERQAAQPDVLDTIMDKLEKSGKQMNSKMCEQLCYEIKTFLLAGHETSAAMLCYAVYEVFRNKEILRKVRQEADAALKPLRGSSQVGTSQEAVENMQYTLAVLKETCRKYPIIPVVSRKANKDDTLCGHDIPAGSLVQVHVYETHQMWSEPNVFNPDRFLPGGEYYSFPEQDRPFMFVSFIAGPRNCLGQHLALLEARIILGRLVQRFDLVSEQQGELKLKHSVIPIAPAYGMNMAVESRGTAGL